VCKRVTSRVRKRVTSISLWFRNNKKTKGVALDKSTHKYRILQIVNGQAKTVGRFHVEKEGIEGYNAYNDMQTKGPLGVTGVPASIGNVGPPGERPFLRASS
jgi:hypothetical protein